jgi:hypothetical protein
MNKNFVMLCAVTSGLCLCSVDALAGEGGTSHVIPGATATFTDLPGTSPATFIKPMYLNYGAGASAAIPTAAGVTTDVDVTANTFAVAIGRTFENTFWGGAHYTAAIAIPYTSLDISGNARLPGGGTRSIKNSVSGLGDITLLPVMLAWKKEAWQFNAMLPVYTPTGSYEDGRLGNPGLNYWTVDPTFGFLYSSKKGFNAMLHMGYAINSENNATDYQSGSMIHFEGALQQIIPVGKGMMTLGLEGFYFDQLTCDSGGGAVLGCFKGMTAGLGPELGYIKPLGKETLILELKWLTELDTKNRVEGDYLWFKAIYKF